MLFPYQIGDVPLFRYLVGSEDPIQGSVDSAWDIPAIRFSQSGANLYQGPANRNLQQPVTMKIEGIVQAKSTAMAQELQTALQFLGGRLAVPVIVFRYEDGLQVAGEQENVTQIDWLVADAIIVSKNQPMSFAGLDLANAGHVRLRLDIEITLMSPFRRLYPWFWEYRPYRSRQQNPYIADGTSSGSLLFTHPKVFSNIQDEYYFARWLDPNTLLDPDFWEIAFQTDGAGQGMEFEEVYEVFYHSDPLRWSSPPQVVYAFTNLLPYGYLKIIVQRSTGQFYNDDYEESSTIDLEQLDTDLSLQGYGGLFNTDILYVGDIFPSPSYILRNGEILADLTPAWEYNGLFPGELQGGAGRVQFAPNLSSMLVAYHFAYGVY